MGKISKTFAVLLTLLIATSCLTLLTTIPANAQTIPKPSVPEFTLRLIDSSYDISPTSTVHPYTGETTTIDGKHIESRTIEIRIKNEPFTPFEIQQGTANWSVGYFYQIRWKGNFETDWHEMFLISDGLLGRDSGTETVFAPEGTYSEIEGLSIQRQGMYTTFPPHSKIDFQVKAMIGYIHRVVSAIPGGGWLLTGESSDWSSTQTITIPSSSASVAPAPTDSLPNMSPTFPSNANSDWTLTLTWIIIGVLVVSVISLLLYVRHLKRSIKPASNVIKN